MSSAGGNRRTYLSSKKSLMDRAGELLGLLEEQMEKHVMDLAIVEKVDAQRKRRKCDCIWQSVLFYGTSQCQRNYMI